MHSRWHWMESHYKQNCPWSPHECPSMVCCTSAGKLIIGSCQNYIWWSQIRRNWTHGNQDKFGCTQIAHKVTNDDTHNVIWILHSEYIVATSARRRSDHWMLNATAHAEDCYLSLIASAEDGAYWTKDDVMWSDLVHRKLRCTLIKWDTDCINERHSVSLEKNKNVGSSMLARLASRLRPSSPQSSGWRATATTSRCRRIRCWFATVRSGPSPTCVLHCLLFACIFQI